MVKQRSPSAKAPQQTISPVSKSYNKETKTSLSSASQNKTTVFRCGLCLVGILLFTVTRRNGDKKLLRSSLNYNDDDHFVPDKGGQECSIYMAPSSIKGVTSMGIFTTRDIPKKATALQGGTDGPSITILTDKFRASGLRFPKSSWIKVWGHYAWGRGKGVPDHINYEGDSIMEYQTTFGALPNHHCVLSSTSFSFPDVPYDDSFAKYGSSPSTGASTYNTGRDWRVKRDVKAGEELFLNYGHCSRAGYPSWIPDSVPTPDEYKAAAKFLKQEWAKLPLEDDDNAEHPVVVPDDMDDRVATILPPTFETVFKNMPKGNIDSGILVKELARKHEIEERTPEWIRENGKCLEHLKANPSTLPDAGRGGFAQHFIPKGSLVVPTPMVHVMDRDWLAMYDKNGAHVGDQVVLNYCFSHPESTVALCPNTNALLINHCSPSSRDCRVNAKLTWAIDDSISEEWRQMSLEELSKQNFRGLAMEIVTTRNIAPGDEVFLDYGVEWEEAWKQHVAHWSKKRLRSLSAKEANNAEQVPSALITNNLKETANDSYLFTGCQFWLTDEDDDEHWKKPNEKWKSLSDEDILKAYSSDGSQYGPGSYARHSDFNYWPCSIIREDGDNTYLVRIEQSPFFEDENWHVNELPRLLSNYPRESIHFFVRK
eukprot:CAMPEP_0194259980 /NCGR_PEP_ID=MMETSP0158-20130606/44910_1 /TAXON_ID=33649 /ORGANISM="Thalassionema nitzschioides, Strain L26-B" /LENGTH=653 /DNA_ID=CAMNT_0039000001 /DNA_START=1 /DNA_END=1959 /DNA_ORIENTATION=-